MGIDAGFDMVPRLTEGDKDRRDWDSFIKNVKAHYDSDEQVEMRANYLLFKAGEHPKLPFEGQKFLRFSSKISGNIARTTGVEDYIRTVTLMAKRHFGSRIHYWNEACDQQGHYGWADVNDSFRSYQQPTKSGIIASVASNAVIGDPPKYDIVPIPGKGKGLVARVDIASGTRILVEKPLFTVRNMSSESLEAAVVRILRSLPKEQQRQFLSLHNNFPGKFPFSGITKTNALPCGAGSHTGGVYPTISLINHSCLPNAHNNWNEEQEHETIHAIRAISSGEEITITYSEGGPSDARQAKLRQAFGFECTCVVCSLSPTELQASDARHVRIGLLDSAIGDPFRMMHRPGASIADCRSLLQVLEEEYGSLAGAWLARLYYDAFQISIAHSDQARAAEFASRAYEARRVCEGDDSPTTARMKRLSQVPSSHGSFGASSTRWKTKVGAAPHGLDTVEHDKWLWRLE